MSLLLGAPPHVIRLSGENLSNAETLRLLTDNRQFVLDSIEAGLACIEIVKRTP
jgi:predicted nuclease of predicted toxin-antitoxin system